MRIINIKAIFTMVTQSVMVSSGIIVICQGLYITTCESLTKYLIPAPRQTQPSQTGANAFAESGYFRLPKQICVRSQLKVNSERQT